MGILGFSVNILALAKPLHAHHIFKRSIARWIAPTLRELQRRAEMLEKKPARPNRRTDFADWNYRAEIFAFGKRLQEEFQLTLLQTALTQRSYIIQEELRQRDLGIEEIDHQMQANDMLVEQGAQLSQLYVQTFIKYALPNLPVEGQSSFGQYLLSTEHLAYIATNLGMTELILSADYPPSVTDLALSLLAVIGALGKSNGEERASCFVRDFICTQLNQIDPLDLWPIENPQQFLKQMCKEREVPQPEARLLGDCGKNTVLAAYQVGLYADKRMLGKGFGEDIATAIKTASIDALQNMFGIRDNMKPFNFQLQVQAKN